MEAINPYFKVGDLVVHRTNKKIKMVVVDVIPPLLSDYNKLIIWCKWFDKKGEIHREAFNDFELIKYDYPTLTTET